MSICNDGKLELKKAGEDKNDTIFFSHFLTISSVSSITITIPGA